MILSRSGNFKASFSKSGIETQSLAQTMFSGRFVRMEIRRCRVATLVVSGKCTALFERNRN